MDIITFTSPTTARHLIDMVGLEPIRAKRLLAIGPITLQELQKHGLAADVCAKYSADGILQQLIKNATQTAQGAQETQSVI